MSVFRNRWWVVAGSAIGLTVSAGPVNNFLHRAYSCAL